MKRFFILLSVLFCNTVCADTETIYWYIEGQLLDTTTCESGGNINAPNVSERFGYTFEGWEPAIYDMSTLDQSINSNTGSCYGTTWQATFSYGTVYGEGRYTNNMCYCRVTAFKPTGDYKMYDPLFSDWVYDRNTTSCACDCKQYVQNGAGPNSFRVRLYGGK